MPDRFGIASAFLHGLLTKSEAQAVIEAEIAYLRAESAYPGWTNWGLVAAFASLAWITTQMIGQGITVDPALVIFFVITLQLGNDLIEILLANFSEPSQAAITRIFSLDSVLMGSRPYLGLYAIKYTTLLVLTLEFARKSGYNYLAAAHFASRILACIGTLYIWRLQIKLPISSGKPATWTIITDLAETALCLSALSICGAMSYKWITKATIPDFQLAAILFSVSFLSSLYLSQVPIRSRLNAIADIRRCLSFDLITPDDASKKLQTLVVGHEITEYFQKELLPAFESLIDIADNFERISNLLSKDISTLLKNDSPTKSELAILDGNTARIDEAMAGARRPKIALKHLLSPITQLYLLPADAVIAERPISQLHREMSHATSRIWKSVGMMIRPMLANPIAAFRMFAESSGPAQGMENDSHPVGHDAAKPEP